MNKNISIIGGDLRTVYLVKLLKNEGFLLYTYGIEKADLNSDYLNITKCENLKQCIESSNFIISAIPFSKDNIYVNTGFSNNKIRIDEIAKIIDNKTFIAGNIPNIFYQSIENKHNTEIIDIMDSEELAILNSISTAEGAIKIAIENTNFTIHGSNVLILGFGRIGKVLAKMLDGIGAKVFCEARKKEDLAWIEAYRYNKVNLTELENNLGIYDIIFNTIPYEILNKNKLKLLKKEVLVIDLASKPGGVDKKCAEEMKIKVIWALGLPRKNCSIKCS